MAAAVWRPPGQEKPDTALDVAGCGRSSRAVGLVWWARTPDSLPASPPAVASLELLTGVARVSGERRRDLISAQLLPNAVGGRSRRIGAETRRT